MAVGEEGDALKGKDLTGRRFGKLTVLEKTDQRIRSAVVWRCRCDCGNEILVESRRLKPGVIYSCGCEPSPYDGVKDLTGYRFGKLLVKGKSGNKAKDGNPLWLCQCDCGKEIETTKRKLITGGMRSCGCGRTPPLKQWIGKRFGMLTVTDYVGKENGFHIWHCKCDCGNEIDARQSNLQNNWTKSCGCLRQPTKLLHYEDGTCVEMLNPDLMFKSNTSGVRGVYYSKQRNKWIAQIVFKQKCYYLGGYDYIEDAADARAEAEEKLFGDFLQWYYETHPQKKANKKKKEDAKSESKETSASHP